MNTQAKINQTVDTCGTRCPIPILRAKQALKQMQAGECLKVLATDPAAKPDFEAMLSHLPHQLVAYDRVQTPDGEFKFVDSFLIQKGQS